jgi:hypothetical protein
LSPDTGTDGTLTWSRRQQFPAHGDGQERGCDHRGLDPDLCHAAAAIIGRLPVSTWEPEAWAEAVRTGSTEPTDRLVALAGGPPATARRLRGAAAHPKRSSHPETTGKVGVMGMDGRTCKDKRR